MWNERQLHGTIVETIIYNDVLRYLCVYITYQCLYVVPPTISLLVLYVVLLEQPH